MKWIKRAGDLRVMGTAGVPQKSACQMGIVRKQARLRGGGSVPLAIGDAGRN